MTRTFLTAAIATLALTATVADARTNARQRGNASGLEAKERMATKELNAQQLAGVAAMPMAAPPQAAMTPASPDMAAPATGAMPAAPDAAATGMSPSGMAPSSEAVPATDPAMPAPPTPTEPR